MTKVILIEVIKKHLKRLNAIKEKAEFEKKRAKLIASKSPNYEDLPKRIKGDSYCQCPHCKKNQCFPFLLKKTIETQQGPKEIFQCEDTNCNGLFRS